MSMSEGCTPTPTESCDGEEVQDFPFPDTLQTTIDHIRKTAGRYDLSDVEIIAYINDAQRHLDRMIERRQQRTQTFQFVPAGTIGVVFSSRCRSIERVYALDPGGDDCGECYRIKLTHRSWREFHGHIRKRPQAQTRWPQAYTEAILHRYPGNVSVEEIDGVVGFSETAPIPAQCNGIIIHPPPNRDIQVEVVGDWYDDIVDLDWPYSWWLVNHPDMVRKATIREMEIDLRNKEGRNDWDDAMAGDLKQIDFDEARESSYNVPSRMEG